MIAQHPRGSMSAPGLYAVRLYAFMFYATKCPNPCALPRALTGRRLSAGRPEQPPRQRDERGRMYAWRQRDRERGLMMGGTLGGDPPDNGRERLSLPERTFSLWLQPRHRGDGVRVPKKKRRYRIYCVLFIDYSNFVSGFMVVTLFNKHKHHSYV